MDESNTEIMGRKIFFLHPSAYVQNTIIEPLIQQEFEIFLMKDEAKILKILKKHPNSIVFACIDETLTAKQWETWVLQLKGNPVADGINLGILSNTNNDDVRQLYVDTFKVSCGFIPIKPDKDKAVIALIEILNRVQAKGRRKYVRTSARGETMTTINLPMGDNYVTGEIRDISVVGLSCTFSKELNLEKNAIFRDIQIKLQSTLLKVEGFVYGSRTDGTETIYVFLFSSMDPTTKVKMRSFIQKRNQTLMDVEALTIA